MTPKRVFAVIMGGIALARGYGYTGPDSVPDGLSTLALVPGGLGTWGWVWVACGLVAIIGAFTKRQNVTMVPFVLVNLLWGGSYLIQWIGEIISHGIDNRNWITCLSYFGVKPLRYVDEDRRDVALPDRDPASGDRVGRDERSVIRPVPIL